ncbi:MAG TPA: hypothetical protein PLF81_16075 [Candidatus Anammoximicrobium sp.]|nr:hypothetical protein [Candidatus Anammoximicrobium sp.]
MSGSVGRSDATALFLGDGSPAVVKPGLATVGIDLQLGCQIVGQFGGAHLVPAPVPFKAEQFGQENLRAPMIRGASAVLFGDPTLVTFLAQFAQPLGKRLGLLDSAGGHAAQFGKFVVDFHHSRGGLLAGGHGGSSFPYDANGDPAGFDVLVRQADLRAEFFDSALVAGLKCLAQVLPVSPVAGQADCLKGAVDHFASPLQDGRFSSADLHGLFPLLLGV